MGGRTDTQTHTPPAAILEVGAGGSSGVGTATEPASARRPVDWPGFLRENVAYILAARPNSAALHLQPPA